MEGASATATATSAVAASSSSSLSSSSSAVPPALPPVLLQSQSLPVPLAVLSLDDSELGPVDVERSQSAFADNNNNESSPDVMSPSQCPDYEKFFPVERLPAAPQQQQQQQQQQMRRAVKSATSTPVLKPMQHRTPASLLAFQRLASSGRRMSEPALFSLGPGISSASSTTSSTNSSAASSAQNSPLLRRRLLLQHQQQQQQLQQLQQPQSQVKSATPQRRMSASSSALAAAQASMVPPSAASNLHLHQTRANAINSMLKQHSEAIIAEGKDIFLLAAQRKRSWTGQFECTARASLKRRSHALRISNSIDALSCPCSPLAALAQAITT